MNANTEMSVVDLEKLRAAMLIIQSVLSKYEPTTEPLTTAERDRRLKEKTCLWCDEPIKPKQKNNRGVHEYCGQLARAKEDETILIRLNRLMPAKPGGRPSSKSISSKAEQLRDSNRRSKSPTTRDENQG